MIATPITIELPLRTDEGGVIRVGNTHVTLITIVGRYQAGDTPEVIHRGFPTVPLSHIYLVIGYYLENQDLVDAYIQGEMDEHDRLRREWEAEHPPKVTKADLLARLEAQKKASEDV